MIGFTISESRACLSIGNRCVQRDPALPDRPTRRSASGARNTLAPADPQPTGHACPGHLRCGHTYSQRAVYVSRAKIRALGEQVIATLKTWRLLRKLRCSTTRIDDLVKATLALHRGHHAEVGK